MDDLLDLDVDQLLAAFLDACRDSDRDAALDAIHELRFRTWRNQGRVLPRDPRTPREETKRLLAASVALAQCRDALSLATWSSKEAMDALAAADAALK